MEITNKVAHRSKSICKNCGKEIFYDANDGFWDHLTLSGLGESNKVKRYSPICKWEKENVMEIHEPKNICRNKNGECYWGNKILL